MPFKTVRTDKYTRARQMILSHMAMRVNIYIYIRTCNTGIAYLYADSGKGEEFFEIERRIYSCKFTLRIEIIKNKNIIAFSF